MVPDPTIWLINKSISLFRYRIPVPNPYGIFTRAGLGSRELRRVYGRHIRARRRWSVRRELVAHSGGCTPRENRMSWVMLLAVLFTAGLFIYLMFALFKPEKF